MHPSCKPCAVAHIRGGQENPCLWGRAEFFQRCDGVLVVVRVSGLPRNQAGGFFALHIHEGGSCAGEDFSETGGHYNPQGQPHPFHAGDLPPLLLQECRGKALLAVLTDRFRVKEVIGKTIVIHGGADDFHSQPAGNAGRKIACGVIRHLWD